MTVIRRATHIAAVVLAMGIGLFLYARTPRRDTRNAAGKYEVSIENFSFRPAILKIPVGSVVIWTNKDEEPHTVFSADNAFKSRALDTDQTFSFVFEKPGKYKYFCSVHPKMVGTIYVAAK